jgi:hypothetical protein
MATGLLCALPERMPTHGAAKAHEVLATTRDAVNACPGYLQPLTDAAFGTPFTRVTARELPV